MPRPLKALLVILAAQGAAVALFFGVEWQRGRGGSEPFRFERLPPGQVAPDLVLARSDGTTRSLSDLRGKSVLLHFWATWCPPCRSELPHLLTLGRELSRDGRLEVVAVTLDTDWSAVRDFFGGMIPPEIVQDRSGRSADLYDVSRLPDTYLVSPDGTFDVRFGGARDWNSDEARETLEALRKPR